MQANNKKMVRILASAREAQCSNTKDTAHGISSGGGDLRNITFPKVAMWVFLAYFYWLVPSIALGQVLPAYPVVLVHGINSSGVLWESMTREFDPNEVLRIRVRAAPAGGCEWFDDFRRVATQSGWSSTTSVGTLSAKRYFAIDFSDPNDLSFIEQGKELKTVVDCVTSVTGISKVILIAHSMGGLASRTYLQSLAAPYAGDVQQLITIGTPHAGAINISKRCSDLLVFYPEVSVLLEAMNLGCWHKAVQELQPGSQALNQLNASDQSLPPIPYTTIVGQYGVGWPFTISYEFGTDGIVSEASQTLLPPFPLVVSNHQRFQIPITKCDGIIPHVCEASDSFVKNRIKKILSGSVATATATTGVFVNLTTTSVYISGEANNAGFAAYDPSFSWGLAANSLTNTVTLPRVTTQGYKAFVAQLTSLSQGQTIYYRLNISPAGSSSQVGGVLSVTIPAAVQTFLPAPLPTQPVANAIGQDIRPYLGWNAVVNATSYRILVAKSAAALPVANPGATSCSNCLIDITAVGNMVHLPGNALETGKTYFWTVHARSPDRFGLWSAPQSFSTATSAILPAPSVTYPVASAVATGVTPTITWSAIPGATSYRIMVAQGANQLPDDGADTVCNACTVNTTVTNNLFTVPIGALTTPGNYFVQVKARNTLQFGAWSAKVPFSTQSQAAVPAAQIYTISASSNGNGAVSGGRAVAAGNIVSLESSPFGGFSFFAWYENGVVVSNETTYRFIADRNRDLAATFVSSLSYSRLLLSASPSRCGTVAGGGLVPYPPNGSNVLYPAAFSAAAVTGCTFLGWFEGGTLISVNQTDQIYATSQDRQLTAVFGIALANQTRPPPRMSLDTTGAVVLKSDSSMWTWGSAAIDGTITRPTRILVTDGIASKAGVRSAPSGLHFWLGNGDLYGWGQNVNNVISGVPGAIPAPIKLLSNVSEIGTGDVGALAIRTDGSVWMWGLNLNQSTGANDGDPAGPVQVAGMTNMVGVAMGIACNVALKADGTVWTWGGGFDPTAGCLGTGVADVRRFPNGTFDFTPHQLATLSGIVQVSCGEDFCLALRNDGAVFSWGSNSHGQLGDGSTTTRYGPVQIAVSNIVYIYARRANGTAISRDGLLYTWGNYSFSSLGYAASAPVKTPTIVPTLTDIVDITHSGGAMLAMQRNGNLWTWGANGDGGLGTGTNSNVVVPLPVLCPAGLQGTFNLLVDSCSYLVTPSATTNGFISPQNPQSVLANSMTTFTIVPNAGYTVTVGGTCGGLLVGNTFTTSNVSSNCTVTAAFNAIPSPLSLLKVSSRKTHGAAGIFDLDVSQNPSRLTIEPRSQIGGVQIVFRFDQPISTDGSSQVSLSSGATVPSVSAHAGNELIVNFGTTNDSTATIAVTGVNGVTNVSAKIAYLLGDVNGSGVVDFADLSAVKARAGQAVNTLNFQFDINGSGTITASDIVSLKAKNGSILH